MLKNLVSRRNFLASSVAALGAASLARLGTSFSLADETAAPPAKKLGFAFVGIGGFAMNQLLPGITGCKYCRPVALVSGHPDKAKKVAAKYRIDPKHIYNYDNFDSIKDNPLIDVVYIVLPNGMHAEYTVRAFAAGKHVMCEKPMANTAAECRQMIDAANAAGKKLQIGYRMHWDAPTLACIDALRKGQIGSIEIIETATGFTIGDPTQWRLNRKLAGGGCMMDIGIYSLSAARYLSGEEPTEVFAQTYGDANDPRFKEVEQHCDFQLKFPSSVLASCLSSYATHLNRYVVHGSKGYCVLEPGQSYHGVKFQMTKDRVLRPVDVAEVDQFVGEMDGFALALAGNAPFKAAGEEGLQDMRIIEAIYESARTGASVRL
ncbi:MAG: Gfo/Idh/MocA family oxidoreductase [Tepidisphaeraceae bacterium]